MIFDQTKAESADKAVLIGAMSAVINNNDHVPFDVHLWSLVEKASDQALMTLAAHHNEGERWDGLLWIERLEVAHSGSLAHRLVELLRQTGSNALHSNACLVTLTWMKDYAIPLK